MIERIVIGLVTSLVLIAWLVWRRHYERQNLLWAGVGYVVFFVGLAVAFGDVVAGPALFLLGGMAGAMIQHGFDAEKLRSRKIETEQLATESSRRT